MLAKAVAGEAKAAFLPIGPSDILSKFVGESETAVRSIFGKAVGMAKQVESRVAVIFFDEIDALGQTRGAGDSSGAQSPKHCTVVRRRCFSERTPLPRHGTG